MASCKQQSDCARNQTCADGECIELEIPKEREVRRTFVGAKGEYIGKLKGETQQLNDFTDFLTDQLDEASAGREEQKEDTSFWGTVGSIVGFGLGCFLGAGNPIGCKTGAVIGAGIGSLGGRTAADYLDDTDVYGSETYGLTEEEFASFDPDQLLFLKGTYRDLMDDAKKMQADLDNYDKNQWKEHVLGVIGDTWNAHQMAGFGETLWEGGKELFQKGSEEIIPDVSEEIIPDVMEGTDVFQGNLITSIDPAPTILDKANSGSSLYPMSGTA